MDGSFAGRSVRALRDPWTLIVAGVGAGSGWAIGLPLGAVGAVALGILGVGALASAAVRGGVEESEPPPLRPGTAQATLVCRLAGYQADLDRLRAGSLEPPVGGLAVQASDAASGARSVADGVARAIDSVDDAIARADAVARQMTRAAGAQAAAERMRQRRTNLLSRLTDAVDEVGETYTKLVELSMTADLVGVPTDVAGGTAAVGASLDAVRAVFAELEVDVSGADGLR